jgi:hypothetical protein
MAKQRKETYYVVEANTGPRCVVAGCAAPIIAEVHCDDYAIALEMFRGIRREKVPSRRLGDERFLACQEHLDRDPRMRAVEWQLLRGRRRDLAHAGQTEA